MELALGLGLLFVLFLTGGNGKKNGADTDGDDGDDGTPDFTPGLIPGRKRKGPNGEGTVWVEPDKIEWIPGYDDFDWDGNGLFIDPNCELVAEGDGFWPNAGEEYRSYGGETLEEALAIEGNQIIGYIDYMVEEEGEDDPIEVVWRILEEASPMCASVDPETWGLALKEWFNDFLDRVTDYMGIEQIDFED